MDKELDKQFKLFNLELVVKTLNNRSIFSKLQHQNKKVQVPKPENHSTRTRKSLYQNLEATVPEPESQCTRIKKL